MTYGRQDLASYENLVLAWERIQTSTGYEYKKLSEDIFLAFAWNLEKNLKCLSSEITEKIYKPIKTSKYYLPKKSNLVRPITLLSVKDQIYYQAVTNLVSRSNLSNISQFRRNNVFGGLNVKEPNSIFYLSDWRQEYQFYKDAIKASYEGGRRWLTKFDLASFYDVIDHKILIDVSSCNALDEDLRHDFFEALQIWTQPQSVNFSHSHGIPQGPVASQVLADIYLHHLDTKIIRLSFPSDLGYFRYVDDIVLLSKTEKTAQESLIKLDIYARELALIPQSGKISIKEIKDIKSVLKGENSIFDLLGVDGDLEKSGKRDSDLKRLLLSSVELNEADQVASLDDTAIKYALNRSVYDPDVSVLAVKLIKRYPHLAESCVSYLNRCEFDSSLSQELLKCVEEEPVHDWHTAKLICLGEKLVDSSARQLFNIAINLIRNSHKHWFLRREAAKFISSDRFASSKASIYSFIVSEIDSFLARKTFLPELPYCITLLKIAINLDFDLTIKYFEDNVIGKILLPDDFYLFLGFYTSLLSQELPLTLIKHPWIANNLLLDSSGLVDGISCNLVDFYDLPEKLKYEIDFRDYLEQGEYEAALSHLVKARGLFERDPNIYFSHTDNFNQIVLASLYSRDSINIEKYQLGNMIAKLKNHVPYAFPGFDRCHSLRCDAPEIHAYSEARKSVNVSTSSRFRDRDRLKPILATSYEALLEYISEKHIMKIFNSI